MPSSTAATVTVAPGTTAPSAPRTMPAMASVVPGSCVDGAVNSTAKRRDDSSVRTRATPNARCRRNSALGSTRRMTATHTKAFGRQSAVTGRRTSNALVVNSTTRASTTRSVHTVNKARPGNGERIVTTASLPTTSGAAGSVAPTTMSPTAVGGAARTLTSQRSGRSRLSDSCQPAVAVGR